MDNFVLGAVLIVIGIFIGAIGQSNGWWVELRQFIKNLSKRGK